MTEFGEHYQAGAHVTRRTVGSAAWSIVARLIIKGIDFIALLILARLLAPADFGIIAIAMTSVMIVEAVLELPTYQVIVGLQSVERGHLDTAFTLSALRGLAVAMVLATLAVPLSHFYGDPRLTGLVATLSLAPAMRGLGSPRLAVFAKELDFRRELAGEVVSKTIAFVLASAAAWALGDYRALMVGILATPATWIVVSYALAPYRPHLSLQAWPLFVDFLSWTTAAQLLSALNWQCDRLILGRFVGSAALGSFSLANDLSYLPEQALIKPIVRPLASAFTLIRDDRERLASAYLKAANTVLAIGAPVLIGLSLLADPVVRLALGSKWLSAIPVLQWLPLTLIPPLFTSPFSSLVIATSQPHLLLRQTAAEAAVKLPLVLLGAALLGVDGVIAARGISAIVTMLVVLRLTARLIGTPINGQLVASWRTAVGGLVLAGLLLLLRPMLAGQGTLKLCLLIPIVGALGLAGYVLALALLWHLSGRPAGLASTLLKRAQGALGGRPADAWR